MSTTTTAADKAAQAAETVKAGVTVNQEVRDATKMKVGEAARQGDIYIVRIADEAPYKMGPETKNMQLARGNTEGSRHICGEGKFKVYTMEDSRSFEVSQYMEKIGMGNVRSNLLLGPAFEVTSKEGTITHPQHAHIKLGQGRYQALHQLDVSTMDRVLD